LEISKSAHFEFDDENKRIRFVWGVGRSRNNETLLYTESYYSIVKKVFQEFLNEQDLRTKISMFAHAMNMGSECERIKEICFMLEVMWRYDFSKKEAS